MDLVSIFTAVLAVLVAVAFGIKIGQSGGGGGGEKGKEPDMVPPPKTTDLIEPVEEVPDYVGEAEQAGVDAGDGNVYVSDEYLDDFTSGAPSKVTGDQGSD